MAPLIGRGLRAEGIAADVAHHRARTRSGWPAQRRYDAIVLDVMLPGHRRLRGLPSGCARDGVWAPVLMLTARDAVEDRVAGPRRRRRRLPGQAVLLRRAARAAAGARAPRRRSSARRSSRSGELQLDPATRRVMARRRRRSSSRPKEFALLEAFLRRPGRGPRSRFQLLEHALGLRLREPLERRRRLRALPAREDRPAVRRRVARDGPRRRLPAAADGGRAADVRPRARSARGCRSPSRSRWPSLLAAAGAVVYLRAVDELDATLDAACARARTT